MIDDEVPEIPDENDKEKKLPKKLPGFWRTVNPGYKAGEIKYDPMVMDRVLYETITELLERANLKRWKAKIWFVNHLIQGRPHLWDDYYGFRYINLSLVRREIREKSYQELLDKIEDMNDFRNLGLSLKGKRKKPQPQNPYQREFNFLDENITKIENFIYLTVSPKRMCMEFAKQMPTITPIIFHRWKEETQFIERLRFAYTCSAEEHMNQSREFLLEWLGKPELDMQHVGIVREVALWSSRMAEYLNRKQWGKKVEVIDDRPQQKVMDGKDLKSFLSSINTIAGNINNPTEQDEFEEDFEEQSGDFTDFEEVK